MTSGAGALGVSDSTAGPKRFFTIAQANRALVLVRRIIADIISDYQRLSELQEVLEAAQQSARYDQAEATGQEVIRVVERIQSCARELEEVGVQLEDWTVGVVGFPSIADGREVTLTWRPDELKVMYWHEVGSEPAERQPIDTLPTREAVAGRAK